MLAGNPRVGTPAAVVFEKRNVFSQLHVTCIQDLLGHVKRYALDSRT